MQTIEEWVVELQASGKTVIVEGKKDARALRMLGITRVVTLSRKPLFAIIEEVADCADEVVILTDLDKTGKQLYGTLAKGLASLGVQVDNRFREFLLRCKLSHVEGLATYVNNCER
jgi:5S rRNA maturation endonuclease (ribonuclease M5)